MIPILGTSRTKLSGITCILSVIFSTKPGRMTGSEELGDCASSTAENAKVLPSDNAKCIEYLMMLILTL